MATITANDMAKDAGVSPSAFQKALRAANIEWHKPGTPWTVERGSEREAEMRAVLDSMPPKPTSGVRTLTSDQLERYAIRCAKGNNGGEWATHYNEDQKNHWRQFVKDLAADLGTALSGPPASGQE